MPLVTTKEMFEKSMKEGFAIGAFNVNNMEIIQGIVDAAHEANSPVILQASSSAIKYARMNYLIKMVEAAVETTTIPIALHLDHGSFEGAKRALKAGYTSVMFDGSHYPFEENVAKTKEIVSIAHFMGCTVEAEVGSIGGEEDGVTGRGEVADPQECKKIADLGIDFLAAGIGNIHGIYPADWKGLNFDRLTEIANSVNHKPLVLHGGTGIPDSMVQKAISLGVAKVNVNTECQLAFADATRKYIEAKKDLDTNNKGFDPRKLLAPGAKAITEKVIAMMNQFGSANKA